MSRSKFNKNTLPLLAITALFLSVALVNYDQSLVSNNKNTQSVLSESDEDGGGEEDKSDDEEEKNDVRSRSEAKETAKPERKEKERDREITRNIKREEIRKAEPRNIKVEQEIEIEEEDESDDSVNDEQAKVEDETETEFEQESEVASIGGTVNRFKLKIKTRTVAGKTIVETASGEVEVEKDPDDTINELVEGGLIDEPTSFEAKVNNREKVEFEIQGTDSKRFLGIFKVVIPKTLTVSSETGEVVSTNQNAWSRILSLLSI